MSTIEEQRKQLLENLINRSIEYRGHIIHTSTIIEKDIDIIIVMYFKMRVDRQVEFIELILDRTSYDSKIAILEQILKKHYYKTYDQECSKTIASLREIKDIRNKFAHDTVYTSYNKNEKIPKEFSLVNFRNSMSVKDFTKGEFKVFNEKSERCRKSLNKLLQEFIHE
ncbi:hypothetical protein [Pedobacter sp. ASV28]|uniref:hypothetical protein n=1 Tax=Pedobacter sp. ASV28 TaxID=2795123 RepID=UPI0018EDF176|nr:hypothetical protein [Pedobacter sp. ASV28]